MQTWRLPLLVATVIFGASAALADETQVERGKYLVTIAGCGSCHTPGALLGKTDAKRTLAGSEVGLDSWRRRFRWRQPDPRQGNGPRRVDHRADYRRHHQGRDAERPQAVSGYALAGPRPSVVGRRPGDRRLPEKPSAGEERVPGPFGQGGSVDAGLRHRSWRRLRQDAGAEVIRQASWRTSRRGGRRIEGFGGFRLG